MRCSDIQDRVVFSDAAFRAVRGDRSVHARTCCGEEMEAVYCCRNSDASRFSSLLDSDYSALAANGNSIRMREFLRYDDAKFNFSAHGQFGIDVEENASGT